MPNTENTHIVRAQFRECSGSAQPWGHNLPQMRPGKHLPRISPLRTLNLCTRYNTMPPLQCRPMNSPHAIAAGPLIPHNLEYPVQGSKHASASRKNTDTRTRIHPAVLVCSDYTWRTSHLRASPQAQPDVRRVDHHLLRYARVRCITQKDQAQRLPMHTHRGTVWMPRPCRCAVAPHSPARFMSLPLPLPRG